MYRLVGLVTGPVIGLGLCACGGPDSGESDPSESDGAGGTVGDTGDTGSGEGGDTAAGSDGGSGPDTGPGYELRLGDVRVEPNPNNALSCIVSWRTNDPATGRVLFGETDAYTHQVRAPDGADRQRVVVIGLHAERTVHLRVEAQAEDGRTARSNALTFDTGALPPEVIRPELVTLVADRVDDGWTLTNLWGAYQGSPAVAVMYDRRGEPVWYAIHPFGTDTRGDADVTWDPARRTVLTGVTGGLQATEVDLEGNVVWTGPEQPTGTNATGQFHHELTRLATGSFMTLTYAHHGFVESDRLLEFDSEGAERWSWDAFDHVPDPIAGDWIHGNAVTVDEAADVVYYSSRNLSSVFKIDRASGEILWRFGADGDFAPDPENEYPWTVEQHDPELLAGGRLLIYDNGGLGRGFSRLVEYQLDEVAMTSSIMWEYRGDEPWFTNFWGDADRLPDGNTLAVAGTSVGGDHSRIFEVTADGQMAWEVKLPTGVYAVGTYKAQRVPDLREPIDSGG